MRILGIDTGFATTGFGVIEKIGNKINYVNHGVLLTPKTDTTSDRLSSLYAQMQKLLIDEKPDVVGIEQLFYFRNNTTIITVGQARGVLLLAINEYKSPIFEVTPLQVKQFVSSYGRADKKQVQKMVQFFLNLDFIPKPDDAADGLAIALCTASNIKNTYLTKI